MGPSTPPTTHRFPEAVFAYIGPNKAHYDFRAALTSAKAIAFLLGRDDSSILKAFLAHASEVRKQSPDGHYAFGLGGRSTATSIQLGIHLRGNEIDLMEREPGGFPALAYGLIYREVNRLFETFLVELFVEIAMKNKRILYSNKQLTHEEALKAESPVDIQQLIIEQRKSELTRGGYALLAKTFEAFGLPIVGPLPLNDERRSIQDRLSFMSAARNVIEHNNSVVNDEFIKLVPGATFSLGQRIAITPIELGDALSAVEWSADEVNRRAVEKFGLSS
jgi:hypothetical protein